MSDRWTDRLSEYLDGELAPDEAREMEAHLEGCAECRETLQELRAVIDRAASLRDREPETDLWAGIAERIRREQEPPEIQVVSLFDEKRARRRISFSVPQLLAAGLVLALASAGSMWVALRGGSAGGVAGPVAMAPVEVTRDAPVQAGAPVGTGGGGGSEDARFAGGSRTPGEEAPTGTAGRAAREGSRPSGTGAPRRTPPTATAADPSARLVGYSDPAYDAAVAELEQILEQGRDRLAPETVQALEESLRTIDSAIDDARRALAADPANARLNTYLAGTMQRKLELLREASQIVTATI